MNEQKTKRILIAAASPSDKVRLRVDQEYRTIEEVRLDSSGRDRFKIKLLSAVQGADFQRELIEYKPHIVHFSGHAEKDSVAFDSGNEKAHWIVNEAVTGLLKLAPNVECVVFNACWTEKLAESVSESINYVIGMATSVYDDTAIAFSKGFYMALFAGESYPSAFEHGKVAVHMNCPKDYDIPQLKIREKIQPKPNEIEPASTNNNSSEISQSLIQIFIISADEDINIARRIYNDLVKIGLKAWLQDIDVRAGQIPDKEFRRMMEESRYVLALLSENSLTKKGFAQKQLKKALDIYEEYPSGDIFLIPVQIDNTKPQDETLRSLKSVKLYESYEQGFKQILRSVAPEKIDIFQALQHR